MARAGNNSAPARSRQESVPTNERKNRGPLLYHDANFAKRRDERRLLTTMIRCVRGSCLWVGLDWGFLRAERRDDDREEGKR